MSTSRDWQAAEATMEGIFFAAKENPFTSATIAQARDFLHALRTHSTPPCVFKGYWNTIISSWTTGPHGAVEIEIFEDHLERWLFPQQRCDIRYVQHLPGEPLPDDLIAELPSGKP